MVEYSESFSVNFVLKYNPTHGMTMTTKFIFLLVGKKRGGGLRREERDGMGGYLRGGLHKGRLHRVEGQYSKWKLVQTLFLIILF